MRKLLYLFVMIAGMTLSINNVDAQDPKCSGSKEAKMACCKSADKAAVGKSCSKMTVSDCSKKDATTTSQNVNENKSACKTKDVSTASEAKVVNTPK